MSKEVGKGRKTITLDELKERVKKHGPVVGMQQVKASGVITVKDKDGKVKGQMEITNNPVKE